MDWYVLRDRTRPGSRADWSTSWRVPAGVMRVVQANGPVGG